MSNVLLEAAAIGRPLITSDIPVCIEAVKQGISGLLCPVEDRNALLHAMEDFLKLSKEEREVMGRAGRKYMEEQYDKEKVVKKTCRTII